MASRLRLARSRLASIRGSNPNVCLSEPCRWRASFQPVTAAAGTLNTASPPRPAHNMKTHIAWLNHLATLTPEHGSVESMICNKERSSQSKITAFVCVSFHWLFKRLLLDEAQNACPLLAPGINQPTNDPHRSSGIVVQPFESQNHTNLY
jgi:hypothetical protein